MNAALTSHFLLARKSSSHWKTTPGKVPMIGTFNLSEHFTSRPDFWDRLRNGRMVLAARTSSYPAADQPVIPAVLPLAAAGLTDGTTHAGVSTER